MTDLLGPASAPNSTTTRPQSYRTFGSIDTWFRDCSTPVSQDGTAYQADFLNGILAQLRGLARGNGNLQSGAGPIVPEVNSNDLLLLGAVQLLIARGQPNCGADTGSSDALVVGPATPWPEYVKGARLWVVKNPAAGPNTSGAPTITVSGLPAVTVVRRDGSAVAKGDLPTGVAFCVEFDGAYFRLTAPAVSEIAAGVQSGRWVYGVDAGAVNAAAVTLFPVPAAAVDGMEILVRWLTPNTGTAPTINVGGIGTRSVLKQGGGAPAPGDLSGYVPLIYDGTLGAWRVNGFVGSDILALIQAITRTNLTASITVYVRPDGSDSNNGLADNAANAFKTPAGAYNYLTRNYFFSGYSATIQLSKTYATQVLGSAQPVSYLGFAAGNVGVSGQIFIQGDISAPQNYVLTPVALPDGSQSCCNSGISIVTVSGVTLDGSSIASGAGTCARASGGGSLLLGAAVTLKYTASNPAMSLVQSDAGSTIAQNGALTITGGGTVGNIFNISGIFGPYATSTIAISNFTFGNFFAVNGGNANLQLLTFSGGNNSGSQWSVIKNGILDLQANAVSAIPGSVTGTSNSGGQVRNNAQGRIQGPVVSTAYTNTGASQGDFSTSGSYGVYAAIGFTALGSTAKLNGTVGFFHQSSTTVALYAYVDLYDNTAGALVAQGQPVQLQLNSGIIAVGSLSPSLVAINLTPGHAYAARLQLQRGGTAAPTQIQNPYVEVSNF